MSLLAFEARVQAAALTIDTFETPTAADSLDFGTGSGFYNADESIVVWFSGGSGDPVSWSTTDAGIIGSARSVTLDNVVGSGGIFAGAATQPGMGVPLGFFQADFATTNQASVSINYSFAAEDFVAAGIEFFDFFIDGDLTALAGLQLSLSVSDSAVNTSSKIFSFAAGDLSPDQVNNVNVSSLLSGGPADASDITAVSLTFIPSNLAEDFVFASMQFNSQDITVPEPSSLAAFIPIAVGVAISRKRRKVSGKPHANDQS